MRVSQHGIQFIADFEGFVDHPYQDSGGVWTIGYGHTGPGVSSMGRITRQRGLELLAGDIRHAEEAVNALRLVLNQHQFDAAVSFVYNCGAGTLHDESSFGRALRNDLRGVPAAMGLYVHDAAGHVLAGLVRRRAAEGALFREPVVEGPAGWLMPGELRECRELDALRRVAHRTPAQEQRLVLLVKELAKQRKRIWRLAQPKPRGDGHGWGFRHRRRRYSSLLARTVNA